MMRWVLKILLVIEGSIALQKNLAHEDNVPEFAVRASDVWDFDTNCWMNEEYFDQESRANLVGIAEGDVPKYCMMMEKFLNISTKNVEDGAKLDDFQKFAGENTDYHDWMTRNYEKRKDYDLNTYCRMNEEYFKQESRAELAVLAKGDVNTYCVMKADFLYIASKDVKDDTTRADLDQLAEDEEYRGWMQKNYKNKKDFGFYAYCKMNGKCFERNSRAELRKIAKKRKTFCTMMADFLNIASQNVADGAKLEDFQELANGNNDYHDWMTRNYDKQDDSTQTAEG